MPSTPYAKLIVLVNGEAPTNGGVSVTIVLAAQSASGAAELIHKRLSWKEHT